MTTRPPRIELRLLGPELLELSISRQRAPLEQRLGVRVPDAWFDDADLFALRLADVRADPGYAPWSLRAICLREPATLVGHVVFHAAPGSAHLATHGARAVELGYAILPEHRGRGYATEAVGLAIAWARASHGVERFVASVSPDNAASLAIVRRLGFAKVGTQIDEIDGPEDVYRLDAP
ncbi:MAG: GNAT family N-acetyltransferase [Kofleriaceae bacterium]